MATRGTSTVKRKSVRYYELSLKKDRKDADDIEPLMRIISSAEAVQRKWPVISNETNGISIGIESVKISGGYTWIAFKSFRDRPAITLMNNSGSERTIELGSEEGISEGERVLTHICIKTDQGKIKCALESGSGCIGIVLIKKYLNKRLENIGYGNLSVASKLLKSDEIPDLIENADKISSLKAICSAKEILNVIGITHLDVKDEIVVPIPAKGRNGISKEVVLDLKDKIDPNNVLHGLRMDVIDKNGKKTSVDTRNMKITDHIEVETSLKDDQTVLSDYIFEKLEDLLCRR